MKLGLTIRCTLPQTLPQVAQRFGEPWTPGPGSRARPLHNPPLTLLQFAQELLSTFSVSLGEVALQPSTGGTFVVTIYHQQTGANADALSPTVLWDRKVDGGFPETKELKRRVRDVIEPGRDLGHVDRNHSAPAAAKGAPTPAPAAAPVPEPETQQPDESAKCEDCQ
jgi:predicted Rdx family selenoprotein